MPCMVSHEVPRLASDAQISLKAMQDGDWQDYHAHEIVHIQEYELKPAESARFGETHRKVFIIGNQGGRIHGWCFVEQIYGKLKFSPHQLDFGPIADVSQYLHCCC